MSDWTWDELGRLAELRMGQSPPGSAVGELRDGLPFLQGNAEFGSRSPRPRYQCNEAPRRAEPGDVLISVRAPVGAINIADQACGIGRGLAAVRFLKLDQRFGHHALQETATMLDRLSQGTTFAAIGRTELASLRLPAPQLEEQRRIAAVLDTVDETIQATERVIAKRHVLRAGLASDLLKPPGAIAPSKKPNGTMASPASTSTLSNWDMNNSGLLSVPLSEIAAFTNGYGFGPEDWGKSGLPIIRIQQLLNTDAVADAFAGSLDTKYRIDTGDLIMSWSGTLGVC